MADSSSLMNPKASPRRKDKTLPASKNQRRKELSPTSKKDGHGKFNWGKPTDYEYDPQEGDDKRVLNELLRDSRIVLVASEDAITAETPPNAIEGPV